MYCVFFYLDKIDDNVPTRNLHLSIFVRFFHYGQLGVWRRWFQRSVRRLFGAVQHQDPLFQETSPWSVRIEKYLLQKILKSPFN